MSERYILRKADLNPDPFQQFAQWLADAKAAGIAEPGAMCLATVGADGYPAARMVLLRGFDERGLVFFTSYDSPKACDLTENPYAAVVLYWDLLHRQVRVTGRVQRVDREESDAYFRSRPNGHRLSAWASHQSQPIANREVLEQQLAEVTREFGDDAPLPPFWGGFRITPTTFEFWQSGLHRLHDRFRYTRDADQVWLIQRLSP